MELEFLYIGRIGLRGRVFDHHSRNEEQGIFFKCLGFARGDAREHVPPHMLRNFEELVKKCFVLRLPPISRH